MAGDAYRYEFLPKKDDWGRVGAENRRWHEGWFNNLYGTPSSYSSTMTGNETFTDPLMPMKTYFLDPNGGDRTFNPSGTFTAGFVAFVKNIGTDNNVIFDSGVSNRLLAPNELGAFLYDGTQWR